MENGTIKLGADMIMMVWVHGNVLEKKFGDGWAEYLKSAEFDKVREDASGKLQQNREPTKGLGKGKQGAKSSCSQAGW